ncbi:MAG: sulfatase-like hydrolase/transferase, partial [Pirellulaceae bacterium]|nr:sulfatase-like hydrolase/transferase [Pirellulaceae bacterium]
MLHNLFRLACCLLFVVSANAAEKMNLLIIQTDEHHFGTLGCYGGRIVGTQNIDWLAKNGVLCTSFYATTPVCSPSRAAFISGHYPQKTPVVNNNIPLSDSVITFAHVLKEQGYATGFAGKWHLNGPGKPQWAPHRNFGFTDNRWMFNRGHWKKFEITEKGPRVAAKNANGQANYNLAGADEKSFATDWLCDRAVDFIHENRDKPFCYYISLPDPHGPNTVRPPYDTMYANVKVPIPLTLQRQAAQIPNWGKPANGVSAAQLRKIMPAYYGMVKCI